MANGDDTGQFQSYGRRETDNSAMIEELIRAENDPKTRTHLIIMNAINNSLVELSKQQQRNAEGNQRVESKLIDHITAYEKRVKSEDAVFNQGKGVWGAASLTLLLINALCFYIWNDTQSTQREHTQAIAKLIAVDATTNTRVTVIEHKVGITPEPPSLP